MPPVEIYELAKTVDSARKFLQTIGCLRSHPPSCSLCEGLMTSVKHHKEYKRWRCKVHKTVSLSERSNSLWEYSNLSFPQLLHLAWSWASQTPVQDIPTTLLIGVSSASHWYKIFREVCTNKLTYSPVTVGGPGVDVQIAEYSLANRRQKVTDDTLIFVAYCPSTGYGILRPLVSDGDILSMIPDYIDPGSIICTAEDKVVYDDIPELGIQPPYQHHVRRSSSSSRNPSNDNNIEAYWKNAKARFRAGANENMLVGYLDECVWRERWGQDVSSAFLNLFEHIADL